MGLNGAEWGEMGLDGEIKKIIIWIRQIIYSGSGL